MFSFPSVSCSQQLSCLLFLTWTITEVMNKFPTRALFPLSLSPYTRFLHCLFINYEIKYWFSSQAFPHRIMLTFLSSLIFPTLLCNHTLQNELPTLLWEPTNSLVPDLSTSYSHCLSKSISQAFFPINPSLIISAEFLESLSAFIYLYGTNIYA